MNIYNIWISKSRISNRVKNKILKDMGSAEELFNYVFYKNETFYDKEFDMNLKNVLKLEWDKDLMQNLNKRLLNIRARSINITDESYPKSLKEFEDMPSVLFYLGDINKLNRETNVAVVGSRRCSIYGRNCAGLIAKELASHKVNVISGLARGIDSFSHRASLENNGFTCGVLGCGIDVVYPKENARLYRDVAEKGCIISEFLPGTRPLNYNFPTRNRIISGLSSLVVVVEAGERSGSLITASFAMDQGKDVIAVPGNIFSKESKGCNMLIKDGAYVFSEMTDLFEVLKIKYIKNQNSNKNKFDTSHNEIRSIISDTPIHIDDIFERCNIDIKRLYELLFELQLEDEIICLAGNYYVKSQNRI